MRNVKAIEIKNKSQFADDLVIGESVQESEEIVKKLNKRLKRLKAVAENLELEFAPKKCESVDFRRKRINIFPKLFIDQTEIEYKPEG